MVLKLYKLYDGHAKRLQKGFNNLQVSILAIGIVAPAHAVSQTKFKEILLNPTVSIVSNAISTEATPSADRFL